MQRIENIEKCQRTSKSTLNENYRKERMKSMLKNKSEQGITLVALVITVIIIIILATVTINMTFGDNGLIKQAELAKDMTANSTVAEQEEMNRVMEEYANIMAEDSQKPVEPTLPTTVAEAKENETKFMQDTVLKDDLNNDVTIPKEFHVDKEDSGTKVEDGIIIEDDIGNQFVWIPVGSYQTTDIDEQTKINELTRRTFTENGATPVTGDEVIDLYYYGEGNANSCTISNGVNSIDVFKESANPKSETNPDGHGGFYIGRYEQGVGNVCKAGVEPYVNVTRDAAKAAAESMYNENEKIEATTELISSYAWDTALNFICQNSEQGYVLATTTDETYGNIGTGSLKQTGEYTRDKYSNICDLLGNCWEWGTEYSDISVGDELRPCVVNGAWCGNNNGFASMCNGTTIDDYNDYLSFRIQLYI